MDSQTDGQTDRITEADQRYMLTRLPSASLITLLLIQNNKAFLLLKDMHCCCSLQHVTLTGQVHFDVDGNTVRSLCMACDCTAVPRLRPRHGSYNRHVGSHSLRLNVLYVSHQLLLVHLLRRKSAVSGFIIIIIIIIISSLP